MTSVPNVDIPEIDVPEVDVPEVQTPREQFKSEMRARTLKLMDKLEQLGDVIAPAINATIQREARRAAWSEPLEKQDQQLRNAQLSLEIKKAEAERAMEAKKLELMDKAVGHIEKALEIRLQSPTEGPDQEHQARAHEEAARGLKEMVSRY